MIKYALLIISTKTKSFWYQYITDNQDEVNKSVKTLSNIMKNSNYIYVSATLKMQDNNNSEPKQV